jgi:hypothetical protein
MANDDKSENKFSLDKVESNKLDSKLNDNNFSSF